MDPRPLKHAISDQDGAECLPYRPGPRQVRPVYGIGPADLRPETDSALDALLLVDDSGLVGAVIALLDGPNGAVWDTTPAPNASFLVDLYGSFLPLARVKRIGYIIFDALRGQDLRSRAGLEFEKNPSKFLVLIPSIHLAHARASQDAGGWAGLAGSGTINIVMDASTEFSGTSHLWIYLEVKKPDTKTYLKHVIHFRID